MAFDATFAINNINDLISIRVLVERLQSDNTGNEKLNLLVFR